VWNQVLVALPVLDRDGAPRTLTSTTERVSWPAPARFFASPRPFRRSAAARSSQAVAGAMATRGATGVDRPRRLDGDVSSVTLARSRRLALSTPAHRRLRGGYLCNFKVILILNRLTA
jgi:hypothetical protein